LLSVICGDGNCSRRATVRLGIDTLIANILVRLELMINAQFCSTGLLFWSYSSMSRPQRQSLVTIGGFYGPDALRGIQTPVGSRVQCTFCVILLLHIYLSVVYLFVCLFICILLELSTYFVLNFLNC